MNILERYFKSLLYIQISPQRITLRNLVSGIVISDEPRIAFVDLPKKKLLGVGAEAGLTIGVPDSRIVNPFGHPRTMVSDFVAGELLLKEYIRRVSDGFNFFRPAPTVVLHLQGSHEGGLTQVEIRAFREMVMGAGCTQVVVYVGPDLSDAQILAGDYPATIG